jgi:hypothetical protein
VFAGILRSLAGWLGWPDRITSASVGITFCAANGCDPRVGSCVVSCFHNVYNACESLLASAMIAM